MNNNVKIALGCFGVAIFGIGAVVGSIITNVQNDRDNGQMNECHDMVIKTLRDEYLKVCKENEQLKQRR